MDKLKITYIGQAGLGSSGTGGAARVESIVSIFRKMGIKIDLISYSALSNKFGVEHKKIDQSLYITIVNVPSNLPKFLKAFAIFPIFVYAWKSCRNCDLVFADFTTMITSVPIVMLKRIFNKPIILDFNVNATKRDKIPAVVHVDGTVRPQTLQRKVNPKYHDLIKRFGDITGIPVLLNTSFNIRGEPIICSPRDAIKCFYDTGLDYLAIGDFLLSKGE